MARARRLRNLLLAVLLTGCVANGAADRTGPARIEATLTADSDGTWLLDYRLPTRAHRWSFERSQPSLDGTSWRLASHWPVTPGVTLTSRDGQDAVAIDRPGIMSIQIRLKPFAEPLRGDQMPFVNFSDGGQAIFPGHFALVASGTGTKGVETRLTIRRPASAILLAGSLHRNEVTFTLGGRDTYVYIGPARPTQSLEFVGIIDPGLPSWIKADIEDFTPRLLGLYQSRLGQSAVGRPMVLAAWGGFRKGSSFSGSVLDDMVVLELAGTRLADPDTSVRNRMRVFLAHETAHFWMGHTLRARRRADSWITEGAAELMAIRAQAALDPAYDAHAAVEARKKECGDGLPAGTSLESISTQGGQRPTYACGAMLYLVAETMMKRSGDGKDLFDWLAALIGGRALRDEFGGSDWLSAARRAGLESPQIDRIERLLGEGWADPQAELDALLGPEGSSNR